MSDLTAGVATTAGGTATYAESWAISLDVTETLAVVALLGCAIISSTLFHSSTWTRRTLGSAWVRAVVGLVAWLLAVVAKALRRRANLGVVTDIAALVAGTAREGRHSVFFFVKLWKPSSVRQLDTECAITRRPHRLLCHVCVLSSCNGPSLSDQCDRIG